MTWSLTALVDAQCLYKAIFSLKLCKGWDLFSAFLVKLMKLYNILEFFASVNNDRLCLYMLHMFIVDACLPNRSMTAWSKAY